MYVIFDGSRYLVRMGETPGNFAITYLDAEYKLVHVPVEKTEKGYVAGRYDDSVDDGDDGNYISIMIDVYVGYTTWRPLRRSSLTSPITFATAANSSSMYTLSIICT
jgi:hypothetical protein